jgi:hypothetical protein
MIEPVAAGLGREDKRPSMCVAPLGVTCPICRSLPGDRCTPMSLTAPHFARVELAREVTR